MQRIIEDRDPFDALIAIVENLIAIGETVIAFDERAPQRADEAQHTAGRCEATLRRTENVARVAGGEHARRSEAGDVAVSES